jgi:putative glutamine amidotransferase
MGQCYVRVLAAAGGVPWLVPLLKDDEATLRAIYDRLDGILLTGGVDVDPAQYGEDRLPLCDKPDRPRDWTEITLLRWALFDRKPILAICRGIQVLNVACGGSLYQDVAAQRPDAIKHDYFPTTTGFSRDFLSHSVRVEADSRLGRVLCAEQIQVNSMHHQGINKLAPGLTPSAFAPDGLVEGVEKPGDQFVIGVQWHPEELTETEPLHRRLFTEFVARASATQDLLVQ